MNLSICFPVRDYIQLSTIFIFVSNTNSHFRPPPPLPSPAGGATAASTFTISSWAWAGSVDPELKLGCSCEQFVEQIVCKFPESKQSSTSWAMHRHLWVLQQLFLFLVSLCIEMRSMRTFSCFFSLLRCSLWFADSGLLALRFPTLINLQEKCREYGISFLSLEFFRFLCETYEKSWFFSDWVFRSGKTMILREHTHRTLYGARKVSFFIMPLEFYALLLFPFQYWSHCSSTILDFVECYLSVKPILDSCFVCKWSKLAIDMNNEYVSYICLNVLYQLLLISFMG